MIIVDESQNPSLCHPDSTVSGWSRAGIGLTKNFQGVGASGLVLGQHISSVIIAAIIIDDHVVGTGEILTFETLKQSQEQMRAIVSRDDDGNIHSRIHVSLRPARGRGWKGGGDGRASASSVASSDLSQTCREATTMAAMIQ